MKLTGGGTFSGDTSIANVAQGAELTFAAGGYLFTPGNLGSGGQVSGMGGVTFGGGSGGLTAEVDGQVVPSGGVSILSGAFVDGIGQLSSVTNAGTIDPATATTTGILAINGDYVQTASGTLSFEIGGYTPGTNLDQLKVSGSATINGGNLTVTLIGGFAPVPGDMIPVMTYSSEAGDFTSVSLPGSVNRVQPYKFTPTALTINV